MADEKQPERPSSTGSDGGAWGLLLIVIGFLALVPLYTEGNQRRDTFAQVAFSGLCFVGGIAAMAPVGIVRRLLFRLTGAAGAVVLCIIVAHALASPQGREAAFRDHRSILLLCLYVFVLLPACVKLAVTGTWTLASSQESAPKETPAAAANEPAAVELPTETRTSKANPDRKWPP